MKNEKISLRCSNEEKEKIRKEAEEIIYEHRFYSLFNELKAKKISRKKYIKRMKKELEDHGSV